ncbi:ABC transporter substrate-binding protein [Streptomyces sp. NPDC052236]|uniref:peptide ABC transporter substrate-binding protein n=1 Tax=Streptomyces sp. NPDC052236 TaxID=3365686 RepID=UPI0037CF4DCB
MRGANSAKWVAGAIVVALAATACGGDDSGGGSDGAVDPNGIFSVELGEPEKLLHTGDTMEANGSLVMSGLFSELVDYTTDGKLTMTNAESVESADSKTWTIKLKKGWTFHDGTPVTAESYVKAWNWNANVNNAQGLSSWFADIKGYDALHPEKEGAKPTADKMEGLKVVDDTTFTVELKNRVPYFAYKLAYVVFAPLPESFYKDPKAAGLKPVGNGPYKFASWDRKKEIKIVRYDDFKGEKAKNGGVTFKNYTTLETAYEDLKSGNVDVLRQLAPKDLPVFKQDLGDRAVESPQSTIQTLAIAFYTDQWSKPKQVDPKVIQGLSMGIDRATITKTVLQGTREPATGWVAKGVLGFQENAAGDVTKYDPAKAKALIKEGGGVPGNAISIQFNTDGGHKEWVDAVCNSITQSTGVKCTGDAKVDFQADLEARKGKKVKSIYRSGWNLDYPVNANFISDLFRTGAAGNQGDFSNKDLDAKIAAADSAATLDESVKQYQAIEKELATLMPSIPLWYYKVNSGYSEKVSGVKYGQDGDPILANIEVKK